MKTSMVSRLNRLECGNRGQQLDAGQAFLSALRRVSHLPPLPPAQWANAMKQNERRELLKRLRYPRKRFDPGHAA